MPTTSLLTQAAPPEFSRLQFRQALGMFATGVTIITARGAQGELVGLTANSFSSVSLEPPLVLWSLKLASSAMNVLAPASHYAINILGADQQTLAERFAGPQEQRWTGVLARARGLWRASVAGLRGGVRVLQPQPVPRGRPRHFCG
jgi:flavin reductase (DIM6/NTAB) family NADH-FMN oxidoreductase RutF